MLEASEKIVILTIFIQQKYRMIKLFTFQEQELFTKQSPQKLKALKKHALIESTVSSNRIEGVEIEQKRVGTVIFGKKHLQDRNEEEVRGYQKAKKMQWTDQWRECIRWRATFVGAEL